MLDYAVLFADEAVLRLLVQELEIAIEVAVSGIGKTHVHNAHILTREELPDFAFGNAVHGHAKCMDAFPAEQTRHFPSQPYAISDFLEPVRPVTIRYLENKYAADLQHANEFG